MEETTVEKWPNRCIRNQPKLMNQHIWTKASYEEHATNAGIQSPYPTPLVGSLCDCGAMEYGGYGKPTLEVR